ncbi:MAG: 30S ribosomal protein S16 [Defluviitaleaceae bacterium]|nr:30S ribosomal protein S16 [Defluviitaleaceae bacterium]
MVKIRLKRMGAKKTPFYRIVVADARTARDGKTIADLGIYDPTREPIVFRVDGDKAKEWLGNGAQPTETVRRLFKNNGII